MNRIQRQIREYTGLDPEKPVSSLSVEQLYTLVKFAAARAISHESD